MSNGEKSVHGLHQAKGRCIEDRLESINEPDGSGNYCCLMLFDGRLSLISKGQSYICTEAYYGPKTTDLEYIYTS